DHQLVGVGPRPLAQRRIERDVAAEERLDCSAEIAHDAARAHDDAAHDAEIADDPVAGEVIGGGNEHATRPFGQESWPISRDATPNGSTLPACHHFTWGSCCFEGRISRLGRDGAYRAAVMASAKLCAALFVASGSLPRVSSANIW